MAHVEPTQKWLSGTLSAFEKIFVPKIASHKNNQANSESTYVSRFPPSMTVCIGRYPSFLGGLFLYLLFLNLFLTMAKKSSTSSPEVVFEKKTGRRDFSLFLHTLGSFTNDQRPGNAKENKNLIGWMTKNNRAARAARTLTNCFQKVCGQQREISKLKVLTKTRAQNSTSFILQIYFNWSRFYQSICCVFFANNVEYK